MTKIKETGEPSPIREGLSREILAAQTGSDGLDHGAWLAQVEEALCAMMPIPEPDLHRLGTLLRLDVDDAEAWLNLVAIECGVYARAAEQHCCVRVSSRLRDDLLLLALAWASPSELPDSVVEAVQRALGVSSSGAPGSQKVGAEG